MNDWTRFVSRSERGLSGFWVVMIILVLGSGIFVLAKFGPIYMEKWDLEDFMEERMKSIYSIGVDGVFEDMDKYARENNIPLHPDDDCNLEGDIGEPGYMECNYDVKINFPGYVYVYHVKAVKRIMKIPSVAQ